MRSLLDPADPFADLLTPQSDPASLLAPGATSGGIAAQLSAMVPVVGTAASAATGITIGTHAVLAAEGQKIGISGLISVGAGAPAYLIVNVLDRVEYTAGYRTSAMGSLANATQSQSFADVSGDEWSAGIVFTLQNGQYVNATWGNLSALSFRTGSNAGDTATLSLFGTSSAAYAAAYAANPYVLVENPAIFTDYGSIAMVTQPSAAAVPACATPNGVVAAALGHVGNVWNDNGCWVLASDIAAQAGASLPLTSTLIGVPGIANGEWFAAYNGPAAASASWINLLAPGDIVSFQTASGGGHITTVVSGHGSLALLVDNITYVNGNGSIANSANDGAANDIIVAAPHAAMQEFSGVNAAEVVIYALDTPVITDAISALSLTAGATAALAADFTASNPKSGQSVTSFQVYETNAADALTVSGVASHAATSASTALTVSSLGALGLVAAGAAGSDTIEIRASNGTYWGDWTALGVTVAAPVAMTVAQALAQTGTAELVVQDSAANIAASADKLQTLASAGRLVGASVSSGGAVALTATQFTTDRALLALLPANGSVTVSGATVAQAAALQASAQVAQFTVTDSAADVKSSLATDSKLSGLTITGSSGADTLNLAGIAAPASISLGVDAARMTAGLNAATLSFIGAPDAITLGSGPAVISNTLTASSGIETIANFQLGVDELLLTLGAGVTLHATDTTVGGVHAIALTGSTAGQGVVLLGQPTSLTAASLLASHTHLSGAVTMVG